MVIAIPSKLNKNFRYYNVRVVLTDKAIEHADRNDYLGQSCGVIQILMEIDGISTIWVKPYEITIEKAEAFAWDEIEPEVLEVLEHLKELACCPDIV